MPLGNTPPALAPLLATRKERSAARVFGGAIAGEVSSFGFIAAIDRHFPKYPLRRRTAPRLGGISSRDSRQIP